MAVSGAKRWRGVRWRYVAIGALFVAFFGGGFYLAGVYGQISELIEQRKAALTSSVFSAPAALEPGQNIGQLRLSERLRRLSYTQVAAVAKPGEYAQTPARICYFSAPVSMGSGRDSGRVAQSYDR